jgi:hypothetical protein
MRNLFDQDVPAGCECNGAGVTVKHERFEYCPCPLGIREREQDIAGFSAYIGRKVSEVTEELKHKLKEENLAH